MGKKPLYLMTGTAILITCCKTSLVEHCKNVDGMIKCIGNPRNEKDIGHKKELAVNNVIEIVSSIRLWNGYGVVQ